MGKTDVVRNLLLIALLAVLAFSFSRMLVHRLEPWEMRGLEDRSEAFRGYGALIDGRINFTRAGNWGMGRTINENDEVMWVRADPARLRVGDIILYRDPSKPGRPLVAQRITEVVGGYFRTKGDALPDPNPYLVRGELEGIVIGVIYYRAP